MYITPKRKAQIVLICAAFLPAAVLFLLSGAAAARNDPAGLAFRMLSDAGWEVERKPCETAETVIPAVFDDVTETYNAMQSRQGLDLSPYKGRQVCRLTFRFIRYPGKEDCSAIRAHVFLADGKVIAGDICSVASDGFMHGINEYG